MKFTVDELLAKLPLPANEKWNDGVWDIEPHGLAGVTLVFFAPKGHDYQTFHEENEYYFIARGSAEFNLSGKLISARPGDAFFVPALAEHHFEEMSDDFATWAVFF